MTSPEYVDYFHALPEETRYRLDGRAEGPVQGHQRRPDQRDLRPALPEEPAAARCPTRLLTNTSLTERRVRRATGTYTLGLRQEEQEQGLRARHRGPDPGHRLPYARARVPRARPRPASRWDAQGRFDVGPQLQHRHAPGAGVFLQNAGVHTHSITSPDLGMGAYRNACIIRELLGREYYPVEKSIAFQEFAAPTGTELDRTRLHRTDAASAPSPAPARPARRRRAAARLGHPPQGRLLDDAGRRRCRTSSASTWRSPPTRTTTPSSGCTTASPPS